MKRVILAAVFCLFAATTFGQEYKNAIGLRLGNGAEVQYERHLSEKNFLKVNGGLYGLGSDVGLFGTCTYNWNCCEWNWTPKAGSWFLNAGVGAGVGIYAKDFNLSVAGDVAFGINFKGAPFALALDYRPQLLLFNDHWGDGWGNIGISCVYRF